MSAGRIAGAPPRIRCARGARAESPPTATATARWSGSSCSPATSARAARRALRADRGAARGRAHARRPASRRGSSRSRPTRPSACPSALITALAIAPEALPARSRPARSALALAAAAALAMEGSLKRTPLSDALSRQRSQNLVATIEPDGRGRADALPDGAHRQLAQRADLPPAGRRAARALDHAQQRARPRRRARGAPAGRDGSRPIRARRRAGDPGGGPRPCCSSASSAASTSRAPTTTPPAAPSCSRSPRGSPRPRSPRPASSS